MAKDERPYVTLAVDFTTNHKIKPLSDAAFRCLVEAIVWCRVHETDGFLSSRLAAASWAQEVLEELSTNDPEKPSLSAVEGGYLIRDYGDHQTLKAELTAYRENKKRAGQKGGQASGRSRREAAAKQDRSRPEAKRTYSDSDSDSDSDSEVTTDVVPSVAAVKPQKARTTKFRVPDDWKPDRDVIDKMKAERPELDLRTEHDKFMDWVRANNRKYVDWNAAWRNWMRNARISGANGSKLATSDLRIQQSQALLQVLRQEQAQAALINNHQGELQP